MFSFASIDRYDDLSGMTILEFYLEDIESDKIPEAVQRELAGLGANQSVILDRDSLARFPIVPTDLGTLGEGSVRLKQETYELPYRPHGGRELDLMKKGLKPLAVFSDITPESSDFLSRYFDPLVARGELIGAKIIESDKDEPVERQRLLYALPRESWRIEAYRLMRSTAKATKWNDALEWIEGSLLGYSDSENALWADFRRRKGLRWGFQLFYKFVSRAELQFLERTGQKAFLTDQAAELLIYHPHGDQDAASSVLARSSQEALSRFYAPLIRLTQFSKGLVRIESSDFEVFRIPPSEAIRLNRIIDGLIEVIE